MVLESITDYTTRLLFQNQFSSTNKSARIRHQTLVRLQHPLRILSATAIALAVRVLWEAQRVA